MDPPSIEVSATSVFSGETVATVTSNVPDVVSTSALASQAFQYDANGNRISLTEGGLSYSYTNEAGGNRLLSTVGPTAKVYAYDASGNVTSDGVHTYSYDDRGRLVTVDVAAASYQHNGQGQRVKKTVGTTTVLFAYDEMGNLIGEYDSIGNTVREHVWFAGAPVAVLAGTDTHYVHTDHLGTPRAITDAGTVIWSWESDAYGSSAANEDPDGDSTLFTYNLRFPGQYYDVETGFHYNYFRTLDPSTGRYLESDPIGLNGGLNTYGYGLQNPTKFKDPFGLDVNVVTTDPVAYKILTEAYARLTTTRKGIEICDVLEKSPTVFQIIPVNKDAFYCGPVTGTTIRNPKCRGQENTVFIDPYNNPFLPEATGLAEASKASALGHELAHGLGDKDDGPTSMNNVDKNENPIRTALGEPLRTGYFVPLPVLWTPGTK